jgi:DNA-binding transcriptional ArsR family regulator
VNLVALALSDPSRRQILLMLRGGTATAGAIAAAFSVSRPAISRHLRVLRAANLVRGEVDGRERIYRLVPQGLAELEAFLRALHQPRDADHWQRRFDALATEVHRVRRERRHALASSLAVLEGKISIGEGGDEPTREPVRPAHGCLSAAKDAGRTRLRLPGATSSRKRRAKGP